MLVDLLVSLLAVAEEWGLIKYIASCFVSGPGSQIKHFTKFPTRPLQERREALPPAFING